MPVSASGHTLQLLLVLASLHSCPAALQVSQHDRCVLRVTITEESGGRKGSDGHKVRRGRSSLARVGRRRTSSTPLRSSSLAHPALPSRPPARPPALQMMLMAVMVTHYNIRMAVYAQQVEDFGSNRLGGGT